MRAFVRWGPVAVSVLALAAPLSAQGRGRDHQDDNRAQGRPQHDSRMRTDGRTNDIGRRQMDDRAHGQARAQAQAQVQDRGRADGRARAQDRGRAYDRGRNGERWRGENVWREDHARIVLQFFSSPRYRYVPRYAYQSLPYGWGRVMYEGGYFPPEYDAWCDNVPADLEYQLPPLYRGYRRFIFGDRVVVIDRITRNIVLVVRI